jgi:hypothetical protein
MAIDLPVSRHLCAFPYTCSLGHLTPVLCRVTRLAHLVEKRQSTAAFPMPASAIPAITLLPQRFFQALFRFGGKFGVRYFADFFRELACHSAHIFKLLCIALAK